MTLKFHNITNMLSFSITTLSDAMFKASCVYFQYVNEKAAHVKIDRDSRRFELGRSKSNFSCCGMVFDYWDFMYENQKALGV